MSSKKKRVVALFPAHPAQLWLMVAVKRWVEAETDSIEFKWFFRDKDVTLQLAQSLGIAGKTVSRASTGLLGNAFELASNIFKCLYYTKRYSIDLWLTKYGCGNIASRLLGCKSISFNDDDEDVVPLIARTSYPFADLLLFPSFTRNYRFKDKAKYYKGFHELAYLDTSAALEKRKLSTNIETEKRYALIRLSALNSHHDVGRMGIDVEMLDKLLLVFQRAGIIPYISTEAKLPAKFQKFIRSEDVSSIHTFLQGACFYIGDSQTMAIESSLLGVPSVRISDFFNLSSINYLEDQGVLTSFLPSDESVIKFVENYLDNYNENLSYLQSNLSKLIDDCEDTSAVFGRAIIETLEI